VHANADALATRPVRARPKHWQLLQTMSGSCLWLQSGEVGAGKCCRRQQLRHIAGPLEQAIDVIAKHLHDVSWSDQDLITAVISSSGLTIPLYVYAGTSTI
jgi:hypothetical protein